MKTNEVVEVSFHTFSTIALDGSEWSISPSPPVASKLEYETLVTTGQAAGWASEPVWTIRIANNLLRRREPNRDFWTIQSLVY
jgi:hypothetical protein